MPVFTVYEVQQEISRRKWKYEVEAADEDSAMLLAENGGGDGVDCGLLEEPIIGDSGFAALPPNDEDAAGFDQALINLESIKGDVSAPVSPAVVEAMEAALHYFEDTRHGKEWIESGGIEADELRSALKSLQI